MNVSEKIFCVYFSRSLITNLVSDFMSSSGLFQYGGDAAIKYR